MPTLLIGYDLNRPGQNYADLIEEIKELGAWWHHLDSTWLVDTRLGASSVRDRLGSHLDSSDELLVVDITGQSWASRGLTERANHWLKHHVAGRTSVGW